MNAKRAAIYCRVSTTAQEDDGTSLGTQEERCHQYVTEHGYSLDDQHLYREVFTGVELWDRPQLTLLREAIRRREIDVVVAYAIDRLSRDPVHLGVILTEAEHAGVAVEFVSEPLDDSPEGQLIRFVRGYAAKVEHMKIVERSIRGKRARIQSGKLHNHSGELYGYRRDKARGIRLIYEPEAAVVREIFRMVVEDRLPTRTIVKVLNAKGIPPPSAGKRVYTNPPREPLWGRSAVRRILVEPAYKGETIVWRQRVGAKPRPADEWLTLPEGTTPAIVSPELWQAARDRLATNKGQDTRNKRLPYLLRGRVSCGVCGRPMRCSDEHGTRTYRCSSRETPRGSCGGSRILADDLETWVWDKVAAILRDPSIIASELQRRREQGVPDSLATQREALRRSLDKVEKQQQRLLRLFGEGDDTSLPLDIIKRELAAAEDEKQRLREMLAAVDQQIADAEVAMQQLDSVAAYCNRVAERLNVFNFDEKRLAIEALDVRVVGNKRHWRLDGAIPIGEVGALPITCS